MLNCTVESYPPPITYWQKGRREGVEGGGLADKMMLLSKSNTHYYIESYRWVGLDQGFLAGGRISGNIFPDNLDAGCPIG